MADSIDHNDITKIKQSIIKICQTKKGNYVELFTKACFPLINYY